MTGETVQVITYTNGSLDAMRMPIPVPHTDSVPGVLVSPQAGGMIEDPDRPEGVLIEYTLYFPKTFSAQVFGDEATYPHGLRNANVVVRGKKCQVVGSPHPYYAEDTPGSRNLAVYVRRLEG